MGILSLTYFQSLRAQSTVEMTKQNGVFVLPCKLNGLNLNFIFDTGASDVSLSLTEAMFMVKNGYLSEEDFGESTYFRIANGNIQEGTKVNLRKIQIGNCTLYNVDASIVHTVDAPLLLGQSAISKLGKFELDFPNKKLIIQDCNNNTSVKHTNPNSYFGGKTTYVNADYSEIIYNFVLAEENRNLNDISTYFSPSVSRYYGLNYPTRSEINKQYEIAWKATLYSSNEIVNIEQIDTYTYDMQTIFTFYNNKKLQEQTIYTTVRFVFDEQGKIIETYNLK